MKTGLLALGAVGTLWYFSKSSASQTYNFPGIYGAYIPSYSGGKDMPVLQPANYSQPTQGAVSSTSPIKNSQRSIVSTNPAPVIPSPDSRRTATNYVAQSSVPGLTASAYGSSNSFASIPAGGGSSDSGGTTNTGIQDFIPGPYYLPTRPPYAPIAPVTVTPGNYSALPPINYVTVTPQYQPIAPVTVTPGNYSALPPIGYVQVTPQQAYQPPINYVQVTPQQSYQAPINYVQMTPQQTYTPPAYVPPAPQPIYITGFGWAIPSQYSETTSNTPNYGNQNPFAYGGGPESADWYSMFGG